MYSEFALTESGIRFFKEKGPYIIGGRMYGQHVMSRKSGRIGTTVPILELMKKTRVPGNLIDGQILKSVGEVSSKYLVVSIPAVVDLLGHIDNEKSQCQKGEELELGRLKTKYVDMLLEKIAGAGLALKIQTLKRLLKTGDKNTVIALSENDEWCRALLADMGKTEFVNGAIGTDMIEEIRRMKTPRRPGFID